MNPQLRSDILIWLQSNVPESRSRHILRVEAMSADLARHHNVDPDKAAQAGLMHDLAKFFKPDRLLAMAEHDGHDSILSMGYVNRANMLLHVFTHFVTQIVTHPATG